MTRSRWFVALSVGLIAAAATPADDDKPSPGSSEKVKDRWEPLPKNMDSRVREIVIDLRGQFNSMDADVSWSLDANELARGFRGPKAKVPEWAVGGSGTSESNTTRPTPADIKRKFPDQYFLTTYDLDRDGAVTKQEFTEGFIDPVSEHFKDVFQKKDKLDAIALKLQVKGIDRAQHAKLTADMKILNANLRAGLNGFNHSLSLSHMSAANAQWRTNVAWYHKFNR